MEYIILNWTDGKRATFKNREEAIKEFMKLKHNAIDKNEEFDMSLFQVITEYNNVL